MERGLRNRNILSLSLSVSLSLSLSIYIYTRLVSFLGLNSILALQLDPLGILGSHAREVFLLARQWLSWPWQRLQGRRRGSAPVAAPPTTTGRSRVLVMGCNLTCNQITTWLILLRGLILRGVLLQLWSQL